MRRVWPVALIGALGACQAILGIEDTSESNGNSSGGSGGSGAAEASVGGAGGSGAKDAAGDATSDAAETGPDTGSEICANGFDDDDDGDVDCADSDCAEWKCAPGVPPGFTGPVAYWEGPTGTEPACAGPFDVELATLFTDSDRPDATCPCTCGQANNQSCDSVLGMWWNDSTCPIGNVSDSTSTTCKTPSVANPQTVVVFPGGSQTSGGTCTATGGAPQKTTTWATTGRVCGASLLRGGCAAGTQCVPDPGDFQGPCIFRLGDVACPLSGYSEKHVVYSTTNDTRSCTSCTCGGASGGSCTQTINTYSDGSCGTSSGNFSTSANCASVSNVGSFKFTPTVVTKGSCPPVRDPTGSCTADQPTTVCCVTPS